MSDDYDVIVVAIPSTNQAFEALMAAGVDEWAMLDEQVAFEDAVATISRVSGASG